MCLVDILAIPANFSNGDLEKYATLVRKVDAVTPTLSLPRLIMKPSAATVQPSGVISEARLRNLQTSRYSP
jgi:hypothetical protein